MSIVGTAVAVHMCLTGCRDGTDTEQEHTHVRTHTHTQNGKIKHFSKRFILKETTLILTIIKYEISASETLCYKWIDEHCKSDSVFARI
jgi:hypothetical protein